MALVLFIKLFREPTIESIIFLKSIPPTFKTISSEKVNIEMRQDDNGCIQVHLLASFIQLHIHALLILE